MAIFRSCRHLLGVQKLWPKGSELRPSLADDLGVFRNHDSVSDQICSRVNEQTLFSIRDGIKGVLDTLCVIGRAVSYK